MNTDVLPRNIFGALQSFQRTEALKSAVELDVFTAIGDRRLSADEIATRCKTSARGMRVLCDFLCLMGLVQKQADHYWLTDEAALYLNRQSPQFIADDAIQVYGGGVFAESFRHLAEAVRDGGTALPRAGTLAPEHPYWTHFARALAPIGAANAKVLAELLAGDSTSVPIRVLDIACGHGHYGVAVAKRNPLAEIFAQDWPAVLEAAVTNARDAGVSGRYHTIPGDVFNADLGGPYDVALIANFLPDFGPAECEQLLTRIRRALRDDGRIVAVQSIPDDDRLSPPNAPALALSLLAQTPHGDVYTYQELVEIFGRAGFMRIDIQELGAALQHVVIARRQ